jgi:di/tricarboxylate transporter
MAKMQDRASLIEDLLPQVKELESDAQTEAIKAVVHGPDAATTNWLWKIFIPGLLALAAVALIGLIVLPIVDKTSDAVVTAFSSVLTGLFGLFAPSPAKQAGGDE